jgi:hypothetical protein
MNCSKFGYLWNQGPIRPLRCNGCRSRWPLTGICSLPVRRFPSKHCATLDSVEMVAHGRTDPIVFCTTALRAFA